MNYDLDTTIWPSRPLTELLDMDDLDLGDFGPPIYAYSRVCIQCGTQLTEEERRLSDECGRCYMDEEDIVAGMDGPDARDA